MAWRLANPGQLRLAPLDPARAGQETGPHDPEGYGPVAGVVGPHDEIAPGTEAAAGQPPGPGLGVRDSEGRHTP
jgi:hypothetical protein